MRWELYVLILGTCSAFAVAAPEAAKGTPKFSAKGADKFLNLAWPTKAPQASVREAVVVTLHELSHSVKSLLQQLAHDIKGTQRDLYALVDSRALKSTADINQIIDLIGGNEHLISLNYDEVERLVFANDSGKDVFPRDSRKDHMLFDEFQGLHHSPAKPGAIWWLAEGPGSKRPYDFAWVIESDVRFKGNWSRVFGAYRHQHTDLVAVLDDPPDWVHWQSCTHPGCHRPDRLRSFLPVFRLSARLAEDVLETLRSGLTGHHEALLYTVCNEERRWSCTANNLEYSDFVGAIRAEKRDLPGKLKPMKLYHPVKSV